jgi:putative membrane protein
VGVVMTVVNVFISFVVIVLLQLVGMVILSKMTPFNDVEELNKGNVAVGLTFGGQFLGTAIILGVSAYTNSSIWHMALWFAVGYVCLVLSYWIFDWLTPGIKLSDQLKDGNKAVGLLLACVYIGIAFAVSSLIV